MSFGQPGTNVKFPVSLTVVAVSSTLSAAISATDTTIPLSSVTNFPASAPGGSGVAGSVKIESEVITYTGISNNSLTGVLRGQSKTTAAAHPSGAPAVLQGVAGTQNDITFDPMAKIVSTGGTCASSGACCTSDADCTTAGDTCTPANPAVPGCCPVPVIMKAQSAFAFEPAGCTGDACTSIRALVLSNTNVVEIPTGSTMYNCAVAIPSSAAMGKSFSLKCSNAGSSDPTGVQLTTDCTDGAIVVGNTPTPVMSGATTVSPTPTPTGGVGPTNTPNICSSTLASAITATDTSIPLVNASCFPSSGTIKIDNEIITYTGKTGNTLTGAHRGSQGTTAAAHAAGATVSTVVAPGTATPTQRRTGVIPRANDDDACAIVSPASSQAGWMLLLPAAMLLWVRRRSRR
jgi:hypothetical protein